jgi:hypothetical protein
MIICVNAPLWPVLIVLAGVCPLLVGAVVRALQRTKADATRAVAQGGAKDAGAASGGA